VLDFLERLAVRRSVGKRRGKAKGCKMKSIVAGIDLGDRESLTTVLSPIGDVADRFSFPMNEEGYAYFASRVPKEARIAFESTIDFTLFMLLLKYTLTNAPFLFFNPLSIAGIAATGALLLAAAVTICGRVKKSRPVWKISHPTDWMFLLLLVLTVAIGILTGIFRYMGAPIATYFIVHSPDGGRTILSSRGSVRKMVSPSVSTIRPLLCKTERDQNEYTNPHSRSDTRQSTSTCLATIATYS